MSHTPGPWGAQHEHENGSEWVVMSGDYYVATCHSMGYGDQVKEDEANARLIAAAPDLLAACQAYVFDIDCGEIGSTNIYAQMKAAIGRATAGCEG